MQVHIELLRVYDLKNCALVFQKSLPFLDNFWQSWTNKFLQSTYKIEQISLKQSYLKKSWHSFSQEITFFLSVILSWSVFLVLSQKPTHISP